MAVPERLLTTILLWSRIRSIIRPDFGAFAPLVLLRLTMPWDLGLPLFVILATLFVMALIFFGARNLLFKPRKEDRTDETSEGSSEDR